MRFYKFSLVCAGLIFNLASLQQFIGINPSYIIIFLKKNLNVYEFLFVILMFSFFIYQTFIEGYVITDYLQIILDIFLGYMMYNLIISTDRSNILNILKYYVNFLCILAIISSIDYYFLGNYFNTFLTYITLWENKGDFIPRLSLTFGNPNWGAFTGFLFLVLSYIYKGSISLKVKLLFLIIFLQSESAIIISILFVLLNSKNSIAKLLTFGISVVIIFFSVSIVSMEESASYFNRFVMYQEILNITQIYPMGLIGEYELRALISKASEDTIPTILTLIYGLGWVAFSGFCMYILLKILNSKIQISIGISLFLFSLVYSFLTTSIVAAIGITLLLFATNKNVTRLYIK